MAVYQGHLSEIGNVRSNSLHFSERSLIRISMPEGSCYSTCSKPDDQPETSPNSLIEAELALGKFTDNGVSQPNRLL